MGRPLKKRVLCPECRHEFWVFGKETRTSSCPRCGAVIQFAAKSGEVLWTEVSGECEVVERVISTDDELAIQKDSLESDADCEILDVSTIQVPPRIVKLIPESIARENCVLSIAVDLTSVTVVISLDRWPYRQQLVEKLEFILCRKVVARKAPRMSIQDAIDWYYAW